MEEVRVERKWVEVRYGENRIRRKRVGKGMGSGKEKTGQVGLGRPGVWHSCRAKSGVGQVEMPQA